MKTDPEIQPAKKQDDGVTSKKKAKKEDPGAAEDETQNAEAPAKKEDDTEDDPTKDEERAARTIFVGNVPKGTERRRIHKLFKPFGKIETVRLRNCVPQNPNIGRRKAFLSKQLSPNVDSISAYVVFVASENTDEQIEKACKEVNMTILNEKHLRVSRANENRGNSRQHSAFVGNLPFDCQEEELIQAFLPVAEKVGARLVNARINRDKQTGVGRGVGFVSFDDEVAVQACINQSGELKLRKNTLRISKATKQENRNTKTYKRAKKYEKWAKKRGLENTRLPAKKQSFKPKRKAKGEKKDQNS